MAEDRPIIECDETIGPILILCSPDGTKWQLKVDDNGVLTTVVYVPPS